jgi:2',3'-cyclic-nucleotide 2'-phosphodiesterase (5'-nucleotidase family)
MQYDAVGLSANDLSAGYAFFKDESLNTIPFVSANIYDEAGIPVFQPYILKTSGSQQIMVTGLTGTGPETFDNLNIRDWRTCFAEIMRTAPTGNSIYVVLSSLSKADNISLLEEFPMVDVVISASRVFPRVPVTVTGTTLVARSGDQGKYLGRLDIDWRGNFDWGRAEPGRRQTLSDKIRTTDWYIEEFSKQQQHERVKKLQAARKQLEQQLADLPSDIEDGDKQVLNGYKFTSIPIVPGNRPDHIQAIVEEITRGIKEYNDR